MVHSTGCQTTVREQYAEYGRNPNLPAVLAAAGGIDDVGIDEAAMSQHHQRNDGGERATRMQALVYGIAALLQRQDPDVGVFDR